MPQHSVLERLRSILSMKIFLATAPVEATYSANSCRSEKQGGHGQCHCEACCVCQTQELTSALVSVDRCVGDNPTLSWTHYYLEASHALTCLCFILIVPLLWLPRLVSYRSSSTLLLPWDAPPLGA